MTHASIAARIEKDIIAAMKARDGERTTALRMVKTALKNREIEKRAPLDEAESLQILTTLIKQRRDSIEQFTKGNRPE
ncbi:MAG: GatB/YqeY domain-containing protein, partial [Silvibacterium sp.]